ncbi:MBL fold metallo-hydrolase [Trinickia violacea]|uniref:MBL fold metallo-hydrolase n=1 Tax=Trinickia violacea TaxID=2571746 RepID=A0A4P8J047_9BURK|nr:MBL fold metallo-hydrolase [Trinickia violacea]QCP55078.1 MBL fold metallo-hydrolase [Trinickia violacea]
MPGEMRIRIWDVEHGACAMVQHVVRTPFGEHGGRLAMIDSGHGTTFRPSEYITTVLGRNRLDYLFITNADQDHMSDLQGLWDAGIFVPVVHRNPSPSAAAMRAMKEECGPLTRDAERFVQICRGFNGTIAEPFNQNMGGITMSAFWNTYPQFTDTNNLSLAVFIKYGNFKILFPGDLEKSGWRALLQQPGFRAELVGTDVLVASHHGRENGFCEDIFRYFTPSCVVISDKAIVHSTQETVPDYRAIVRDQGVFVRTTMKNRHVLTTRRDGWIQLTVYDNSTYDIDSENGG